MSEPHTAPEALGSDGQALWDQLASYTLEDHEVPLITHACHLADRVSQLEDQLTRDGLMVTGSKDQPRLHPAIAEIRQTRLAIARCLGQVPFPDADDVPVNAASTHARSAAIARWRRSHGA